jgi:hypothetical protein
MFPALGGRPSADAMQPNNGKARRMSTQSTDKTKAPDQPDEPPAQPAPQRDDAIAPGSPEARELGCICPEFLNGDGSGIRTAPGEVDAGRYLAHPDCDLHRLS